MRTQIKRQIAMLVTFSLVIGLLYHLADIQPAVAADAAVEVELQRVSRPNEVETSIAEGMGELVVQRVTELDQKFTAYTKFTVEKRGWLWIDTTVNRDGDYPGDENTSTLYANSILTKVVQPNYKVKDERLERLYAYYVDPGIYYLESTLASARDSSHVGVITLPRTQAVYGCFLPSSEVLSVDVETKSDKAVLHCTSAMSDVAYYWAKDTSTVDVLGDTKDFYTNISVVSDIEVETEGEYLVCALSQLSEWQNYPIDIHVTVNKFSVGGETVSPAQSPEIKDTPNPIETMKPLPMPTAKLSYTWSGEMTGWGGPESYPSSANHEQGSGENCFYWPDLTDIISSRGYNCGLEFMNPYNPDFTGKENEMAQFISKMKEPRIRVTLKNGGEASSWNWETELSFPSGQEMAFPDGYLNNQYFVLFGNDDVITKVEIYDVYNGGGQITDTPTPSVPQITDAPVPQVTDTPMPSVPQVTGTYTGYETVYQNNLSIYTNQRSDDLMMEYLLMEPDNVYAYLINDEIRAVCKEITEDCNTDMEKLQAIHDWVCNNIYYENRSNHGEGTGAGVIYVFYHRGTRCEGYADLTAAMCREVGIPCKTMDGYKIDAFEKEIEDMSIEDIKSLASQNSFCGHAWNEAWVDGRWVLLDTTWDSYNYSETADSEVIYEPCKQTYFDMDLKEFSKTHLFASYISIFEGVLFEQWLQNRSTSAPGITEAPDSSALPDTTLMPSSSPSVTNQPASGPSVTKQPETITEKREKKPSKPGRAKITVCKSKRKGRVTLKWKKVSGNNGYQVQYARKRSFVGKRTETAYGKSGILYGLKSKKTYYIRIRAYKYGNSANNYKRVYGRWSKVRKVRVK